MQVMPRIQTIAKSAGPDILTLVLDTISGDAQERARLDADLAANQAKRTWHQANDAAAFKTQIQQQDKGARP